MQVFRKCVRHALSSMMIRYLRFCPSPVNALKLAPIYSKVASSRERLCAAARPVASVKLEKRGRNLLHKPHETSTWEKSPPLYRVYFSLPNRDEGMELVVWI